MCKAIDLIHILADISNFIIVICIVLFLYDSLKRIKQYQEANEILNFRNKKDCIKIEMLESEFVMMEKKIKDYELKAKPEERDKGETK